MEDETTLLGNAVDAGPNMRNMPLTFEEAYKSIYGPEVREELADLLFEESLEPWKNGRWNEFQRELSEEQKKKYFDIARIDPDRPRVYLYRAGSN